MKGDKIVQPCDWHSNETVTLRNHVTKYINMQKFIVKFLRKCENRDIKIARVHLILITKSINLQLFTLILYCVGVCCDVYIFKLTASARSIYREVYGHTYMSCSFLHLAFTLPSFGIRSKMQPNLSSICWSYFFMFN